MAPTIAAYNAGREAYARGLTINPYPTGDALHFHWADGWREAQLDALEAAAVATQERAASGADVAIAKARGPQ